MLQQIDQSLLLLWRELVVGEIGDHVMPAGPPGGCGLGRDDEHGERAEKRENGSGDAMVFHVVRAREQGGGEYYSSTAFTWAPKFESAR